MVSSTGFSQIQYGIIPQQTFKGRVSTSTSPQYDKQPSGDTVELTNNKKSGSKLKKGIIGTLIGLAATASLLYAGVKTGKLTKVDNATKWSEKLQNLAFEGGSYIKKGIDYITTKPTKSPNLDKQFTDEEVKTLKVFANALKEDMAERGIEL